MAAKKKELSGTKVQPYAPPVVGDPAELAYAPPRDPLTKPADPSVILRDVPNMSYVGTWEPASIYAALDAHAMGQFQTAAQLADALFGDDRVQATLGSRTGGLFGQKAIHKQAKADTDGECMAAWKEQFACMSADGVFSEIKRQAIVMGFCVSEILWDTSVTPWRQYLKPWSARYIYYRWDIRRFVAQTTMGPVVIEPGDGKWFVHAPHGFYRGWIHATIRAISDLWFIKKKAWRDWARFNERHGLPIIKAMVPAAGDAKQKDNFVGGLSTMGQEAVVMLPQNVDETGYDIELLEARDRAYDTFGKTVEAVDRSIILAIKSQNLTTEVQEGSFAAARQHGGTEQATLEFDNTTFAYDLYTQVGRPFALFNYGDPEKATRTEWDVEPIEDRAATAKTQLDASTALVALKSQGIPVDVLAFCKQFKIPIDALAEPPSKVGQIFAYHIQAGGIVTPNEVRDSLGLLPIEGGDVVTAPPPKPGGDSAPLAMAMRDATSDRLAAAIERIETIQGRDGRDGRDGVDGPEGAQGPIGPRGLIGSQGPRGHRGADGAKAEALSGAERYAHFTATLVDLRKQGAKLTKKDVATIAAAHGIDAPEMNHG